MKRKNCSQRLDYILTSNRSFHYDVALALKITVDLVFIILYQIF